ncbi:hypothetical protein GCM10010195_11770 [Kitasatospora griseola]|nr:hypothetical protein GCM10010195_11770 [Kitasatospora griseola]
MAGPLEAPSDELLPQAVAARATATAATTHLAWLAPRMGVPPEIVLQIARGLARTPAQEPRPELDCTHYRSLLDTELTSTDFNLVT